jgi:hypothetical protein
MELRLAFKPFAIGVRATLTIVLSSTAINSPSAAVRAIAYFEELFAIVLISLLIINA